MLYIWVAGAGLAAALYTIMRSKRRAELVLLFFVAWAVMGAADWTAFGLLELYTYTPGIVAEPLWDAVIGVFLAEAMFVPSLAVVLVAWTAPWIGVIVGTAVVTVAEILFVQQGIFVYRAWRLWHTIALFPVFFGVMSFVGNKIRRGQLSVPWVHLFARASVLLSLTVATILPLRAEELLDFNLYLAFSQAGNQSLLRFLLRLIWLPSGYWAVAEPKALPRLARVALVTVLFICVNHLLIEFEVVTFRPPWSATLDAVYLGVVAYVGGMLADWLVRNVRARG